MNPRKLAAITLLVIAVVFTALIVKACQATEPPAPGTSSEMSVSDWCSFHSDLLDETDRAITAYQQNGFGYPVERLQDLIADYTTAIPEAPGWFQGTVVGVNAWLSGVNYAWTHGQRASIGSDDRDAVSELFRQCGREVPVV